MTAWILSAVTVQAVAMLADEGFCHRKRGLPRWERIGHPLDTLTTALCFAWLVMTRPTAPHALPVYIALSILSCVFITKDEFIHAQLCSPFETWLHSVLFIVHPIVLSAFGFAWWTGSPLWMFQLQLVLTLTFALYQVLYWSRA